MSYVCHPGFALKLTHTVWSSTSLDVKVHLFLTQAADLESLIVECRRNTNCSEMTKCKIRSRKEVLTFLCNSTTLYIVERGELLLK